MIVRIWVKIFLIIIFAVAPLATAQYFLQKESIEVAFEITEKTTPPHLLEDHLRLLKQISKLDPENAVHYKEQFESIAKMRLTQDDWTLIRNKLSENLLRQTLRNVLVVLFLFCGFSLYLSKSVVRGYQSLIQQVKSQAQRLERLSSIESWQKIARILVHELRAPITPIKLVSTDIEKKYETLESSDFKYYLSVGAELIQSQVQAIETLLESFTRFAKLPEVKKASHSVTETLEWFQKNYSGYSDGQVQIRFEKWRVERDRLLIDPEALKHLFFNLLKNAAEANPGQELQVTLSLDQEENCTLIQFKNNGAKIPEDIASRIFDIHVSSKSGLDSSNLGIGLTISKKIALDHGGDLFLLENQVNSVVFELELPYT